jgi:hypothetical protein
MQFDETISLTFGEQVENHHGMEKIGKIADEGYSIDDFKKIVKKLEKNNITYTLIDLKKELPPNIKKDYNNLDAKVLLIKNGVNHILNNPKGAKYLYNEQKTLSFDKKAFMRGKIVNKIARWNSCFADKSQKPDYENKKGTIINFKNVPFLNSLRNKLHKYFGKKAKKLYAEMNYYYDLDNCGIGFHGDTERRIVICVRLGATIPMHFQWFHRYKPIGERKIFSADHGDIYIMSAKAVGHDWKKSSLPTLRHAAGSTKYTTVKIKKKNNLP